LCQNIFGWLKNIQLAHWLTNFYKFGWDSAEQQCMLKKFGAAAAQGSSQQYCVVLVF